MTTPIESRIQMDIEYDNFTRQFVATAYDYGTGDVYVRVRQKTDHWLRQNLHDAVSQFLGGSGSVKTKLRIWSYSIGRQ